MTSTVKFFEEFKVCVKRVTSQEEEKYKDLIEYH